MPTTMRRIVFRPGWAAGLAAAVWLAAGALASRAEDVVVTRQQTYRGTVKSVTSDGIQFELPGKGVITIPRAAVTQMRVAEPPGIARGIAAFEHGNIREARQSLDRVVFQYQGLDQEWAMKALLYFGRACLLSNEPQNAAKAFDAFLKAYPDAELAVDARLGLSEIDLQNKNYDKVLTDLRGLAAPYDAQLKPPASQIPYAAAAYLGIGRALEAQQQLSEALAAYLRVIALYPDPKQYPEALYHAGLVFNALEQFDKAERLLNELAENYPDHELAKQAEPVRAAAGAKAREMAAAAEQPAAAQP